MSDPCDISPAIVKAALNIRVFGVGNGGGNAVQRLAGEGLAGVGLAVLNTDAQALKEASQAQPVLLGKNLSRGMGAGGDPDVGRAAALEDEARLKTLCTGADIVFIVAGLGGGTGTGVSPVLARAAKSAGALVLCVVTLPFEFEGSRRSRQATLGLHQLKAEADSVICIPNQKIFKLVDEKTSLQDAFQIMNGLLCEGVRGIWRLLTCPALIKLDVADLRSVTDGKHAESAIATVEASGENRAREIQEKLLSHLLLDGGQAIAGADAILVSFVGGDDMSMGEINRLMEQINRVAEGARQAMGAAVDPGMKGRLSVTLIASRFGGGATEPAPMLNPVASESAPMPPPGEPENISAEVDTDVQHRPVTRSPARFVAPAPGMPPERAAALLKNQQPTRARRKKANTLQGQLPLDIISRGRFEKSEPTIVQGEDLDEPTYIRRGVVLN
ncbi:MAG: cell division protein FtsZ [Verrucomicrobiota bacterium]